MLLRQEKTENIVMSLEHKSTELLLYNNELEECLKESKYFYESAICELEDSVVSLKCELLDMRYKVPIVD